MSPPLPFGESSLPVTTVTSMAIIYRVFCVVRVHGCCDQVREQGFWFAGTHSAPFTGLPMMITLTEK